MASRTIGRYQLVKRILQGNQRRGEPELWQAQDLGDLYYVKIWKRLGDDKNDLRALWNREVRSLMRLQSYPGASEIFARLHDLNSDAIQYYVVIDGGRRLLLSEILATRRQYPWLLNLAESARRRPLWEGLLRIVEAISILHREGTLHRSLANSAIFSSPDGNGDFRLSGFEWSLRVAGSDRPATRATRRFKLQAPELDRVEPEYSIATDWFDFGLLTAELFGAPIEHIRTRDGVRSQIERLTHFREAERRVILDLLYEDPNERLSDSEDVSRRIDNIIRELSGVSVGSTRSLILALRLGPGSRLSDEIENASKQSARSDDPLAQRRWVEHDLRGDIRVSARNMPRPNFVLRGENLEYRVAKWSSRGTETWDVGYCEAVEFRPRFSADDQEFSLGPRKLEIMSLPNVRSHFSRIRDRAAAWDKVFGFPPERYRVAPHLRTVHDFFRITQQLDTLLTVAQICPVKVLDVRRTENHTDVELTPIEEPTRNNLALQLGLPNPSEQLRDWFDLGAEAITADEDNPEADDYDLLDRPTITGERIAESWQFRRANPHEAGARYHFRCNRNYPVQKGKAYLARNHGGTFAQIKRRHKAIEDLKSHEALLRLLADPLNVSKTGEEELPAPHSNISVDETKITALKKLWRIQPSFAIQGPPGTGKTTLIQAFADRLFGFDPTAQVLLTAHSHHTVDDVRKKLRKLVVGLGDGNAPILIRLGARQPTEDDIGPVTQKMIAKLCESTLVNDSPDFLTTRLRATADSNESTNDLGAVELHAMELLVQDAANVVFATCNSGELAARLTEVL